MNITKEQVMEMVQKNAMELQVLLDALGSDFLGLCVKDGKTGEVIAAVAVASGHSAKVLGLVIEAKQQATILDDGKVALLTKEGFDGVVNEEEGGNYNKF